jgi:hypothetical protein
MRTIKLSLSLRIAAFVLATLGATGALVAAGLNDPSTQEVASGAVSAVK